MKASVDRSKRKETNDPSVDSLDKNPANKTFWSLHLYHVLQGLTPQWGVRQTRSLPPKNLRFCVLLNCIKIF